MTMNTKIKKLKTVRATLGQAVSAAYANTSTKKDAWMALEAAFWKGAIRFDNFPQAHLES